MNTDPRYKNGIKKPQPHKPQIIHPLSLGWKVSHQNEEYGLTVYKMNEWHLMRHPLERGWIVQNRVDQWSVNDLEEATSQIKKGKF